MAHGLSVLLSAAQEKAGFPPQDRGAQDDVVIAAGQSINQGTGNAPLHR